MNLSPCLTYLGYTKGNTLLQSIGQSSLIIAYLHETSLRKTTKSTEMLKKSSISTYY